MVWKLTIEYTDNLQKTGKLSLENEAGQKIINKVAIVLPVNFPVFQSDAGTMTLKNTKVELEELYRTDTASVKLYERLQAMKATDYLELSGGSGFCATSDNKASDLNWPRDQALFIMDKKQLDILQKICEQGSIELTMSLKKSAFLMGQQQVSHEKQDIKKSISELSRIKMISQNRLDKVPGMTMDNALKNQGNTFTITTELPARELKVHQINSQNVQVVVPKTDYYQLFKDKQIAREQPVTVIPEPVSIPVVQPVEVRKPEPVSHRARDNMTNVHMATPAQISKPSQSSTFNNGMAPVLPGVDYYNEFGMLNPLAATLMTQEQRQNQWKNPLLVQQRMKSIFHSNFDPNDPYGNNNNNGFNY